MEHWYDNEISRGILAAKYYHEGETTPQQFIDRVSSIFKGDFRERMKKYITDGDFFSCRKDALCGRFEGQI